MTRYWSWSWSWSECQRRQIGPGRDGHMTLNISRTCKVIHESVHNKPLLWTNLGKSSKAPNLFFSLVCKSSMSLVANNGLENWDRIRDCPAGRHSSQQHQAQRLAPCLLLLQLFHDNQPDCLIYHVQRLAPVNLSFLLMKLIMTPLAMQVMH